MKNVSVFGRGVKEIMSEKIYFCRLDFAFSMYTLYSTVEPASTTQVQRSLSYPVI